MGTASGLEGRGPAGVCDPRRWGKWRGVVCSHEDCGKPAKCKGYCASHYDKTRRAAGYRPACYNPQSYREKRMRHRYGIEPAEYDALLAAQGGLCAICRQPPGENVRAHWGGKLCVDHDHATGKIRGLLCNDCNLAVGYGKTAEVLHRAAEYVRDRS
jgi:hypothetical protein